jgi:hypothetical protein
MIGGDQPHLAGQAVVEEGDLAIAPSARSIVDVSAGNRLAIGVTSIDARERGVGVLLPREL